MISKRIVSLTAASLIAAGALPLQAFAAENSAMVRVIVENTTYTSADAEWKDVLIDDWFAVDDDSTLLSTLESALNSKGFTLTAEDTGYGPYITEINGLAQGDGGAMSNWNVFLNDWYTNEGVSAYTVKSGNFEAGDEIALRYSCDYGADIGADWMNTSTLLKDVKFSAGTLDKDFDPNIYEYTLTIDNGSDSVIVSPTADNKSYPVRTYRNNYTPETKGSEYKRNTPVPVSDGDSLYIGVANPAWPGSEYAASETKYTFNIVSKNSGNENDEAAAAEVDKLISQIGKVTADSKAAIEKARAAYERLTSEQKALCTEYEVLQEAEKAYAELVKQEESSYDEMYEATASYLLDGEFCAGEEWRVIGLVRSGRLSNELADKYYKSAADYIKSAGSEKLSSNKSTENSKMILTLAALGYDVTDAAGYNLLVPLADFDYVVRQGINGAALALTALDSKAYDVPYGDSQNQTDRDKLIAFMLENQISGGGWSLDGTYSDVDVTAIVITSLAPYYSENPKVAAAVDCALEWLSDEQNAQGDFSTCESTAQVLVALSALGIDAGNDAEFVKNGNSVIDGLELYYLGDGRFCHAAGGSANEMAAEQAFYAMVSYNRMTNGDTALFDMSDVSDKKNPDLKPIDDSSAPSEESDKNPATGTCTKADIMLGIAAVCGALMIAEKKSRRRN